MLVQQRNPNNGTHWFSTEEEGYYGNSKRLIICDPEKGYAKALGMFLSQRRELSLQVQVYTDLEGVEEEGADCLIISDQFPEAERKKLTGKTVFLLTGDPGQQPGEGEEILLQGVIDAWFEEGDSVAVLDFKSDRVSPGGERARAEEYRPQLEAYSRALSAILGRPVGRRVLWFFATDTAVEL